MLCYIIKTIFLEDNLENCYSYILLFGWNKNIQNLGKHDNCYKETIKTTQYIYWQPVNGKMFYILRKTV